MLRSLLVVALPSIFLVWVASADSKNEIASGAHLENPLDRAALAARIGDTAVLAALSSEDSVERLAAVRLAPFLTAKEDALPRLVSMIEGRDPDLAPAAALAAYRIARGLDGFDFARREVDVSALAPVRERLRVIGSLERLRPDLRRLAALASEHLRGAGVP